MQIEAANGRLQQIEFKKVELRLGEMQASVSRLAKYAVSISSHVVGLGQFGFRGRDVLGFLSAL